MTSHRLVFFSGFLNDAFSIQTEQRRIEGGERTNGQIVVCAWEGLRETTDQDIPAVSRPCPTFMSVCSIDDGDAVTFVR
jgi:hypothetical protein